MIKKFLFIFALGGVVSAALGQVTLTCDFVGEENRQGELYNFWDVHNRLPPYTSVNVPCLGKEGAKINCVRMLGGWGSGDRALLLPTSSVITK